jgi:hypothetical protein
MEEKRASRISVRKIAAPKVNRDFVSQISRPEVLTDERFSRMWTDPTMKIDMESDAFKRVKSMKRVRHDFPLFFILFVSLPPMVSRAL